MVDLYESFGTITDLGQIYGTPSLGQNTTYTVYSVSLVKEG